MTDISALSRAAWSRLRSRFVRDVGTLTLARLAGAGLSVIQGILVARWLGPEQYGIAALVMTYPAVLFSFLDAKSGAASVKYISEFEAQGDARMSLAMCKLGYTVDLTIAAMTFGLVAATAWWAEDHIVRSSGVAGLMVVYAAAFLPWALAGTSKSVLSVHGRFQVMAWTGFASTLLRVTAVLVLVFAGWGVAGVVWGNIAGLALSGIVPAVLVYYAVQGSWGGSWPSASISDLGSRRRDIIRFILFTDLAELVGAFSKKIDIIVLGFFTAPQEVGYFRLAKSLGSNVGLLARQLQTVAYPRMSRLAASPAKRTVDEQARRFALTLGAPLGLAVLIAIPLVPWVLAVLVGDSFESAIVLTQIFLARAGIVLAFFWMRPLYYARGHVIAWATIVSVFGVLTFTGYLIVTPLWGATGMAGWRSIADTALLLAALAWVLSNPASPSLSDSVKAETSERPALER